MNAFLKRLTLPAKLVLLGVLPLFFLLLVANEYNKIKTEKLQMIDTYRQRVVQAVNINALIDHLQSERRYAFGYALKGDWQNELLQQRERTDTMIQKLEDGTQNLPGFSTYTFLDQLKSIRNQIDNKTVPALQVMNFYTNAIFRLNTLNSVAAGNVVYLQPIIKDLAGQKILSDIITYEGIVRAQIYLMLQTGEANPQLVASVKQTQEIIDAYLKEFLIKSSSESIKSLESLRTDADVKIMSDYLQRLRTTNVLDTSIDAEHWWDASAKAVDRLRNIQRKMMSKVDLGINEAYTNELNSQRLSFVLLIAMLLLVAALLVFIIQSITKALADLREAAREIARGKTGLALKPQSRDAIGSLTRSIIEIDQNNQELSKAAGAIGQGNFDVPVRPRSEEDTLGNAILQMKESLQAYNQANEEKLWIQSGIAAINDSIRGEREIATLARDAINTFVTYLGCESGLFYVAKENKLQLEAGYAISDKNLVPKTLQFGETLIGQAALKNELIELHDVPDDFMKIKTGAVAAQPRHVLVVPLFNDQVVEGVIEVASLTTISAYKLAFIKEVSNDLAIALRAAKSRVRLQELLEETQAQSEELQSQHGELENLNAELEMQTQRLQASEEELRVQQEELMQSNQELVERSRLLEEKNQTILERNLDIQRKAEELEISTKYKSEFLANMSHELRTPLNSILLLSRLLAENNESNLSNEQIEYAQVIQSSGTGLLSLIDEILDLSKIEAGKMELEYAAVSVREVVSGLQALFAPVAKDKGLEWQVQVDHAVPALIETDRMRLEQILKNLISNALKFTAKGSVALTIAPLQDKPSFISFAVRDTGIGIPKEKQQLVFEAFQQADGSTKRRFGGTGLGLSISRELAKILGGEIKLTSEPGAGSEFVVYIPTNKPTQNIQVPSAFTTPVLPTEPGLDLNPPVERQRFTAPVIPEGMPDDRQNILPNDKVILIIEDDVHFAKALLDYTRSKGYKGIVAVRGDEGIELARQYKPMGILLDIQLPVKDGWEVMEELKSHPQTRPIPVHIMSSHEVKKESLMKGAVDFINKPVAFEQMQEIFRKIEQVVSKTHKKVLIVEENTRHAKALSYFLETFNVNAQVSNTIAESVDALEKEGIDCVILDMGVPDHSAYSTLEEIKKRPGLENLPIIIFTGKNLSVVEASKIKQYADSIVVKTAHSYQRILDEVSLFLHIVEENHQPARKNKYPQLGAMEEVLRNKKILVTDDDVRNIFSITKALEKHQMHVFSAMDGKEALLLLEEQPDVDVVLMDIMMPEMDGYETMRRIKSNPRFKNLPIIAVTAKAMTGDREKCIQAGASDYISKPVDIDQLLSLLRVWLYEIVS